MAVRARKVGEDTKAEEQDLLGVNEEQQTIEAAKEIATEVRVETTDTLRGQKKGEEFDEDEIITGVFKKVPEAERKLPLQAAEAQNDNQEYVPESEIEQVVDVVGEDIPVTTETLRDTKTMLDRIDKQLTGRVVRWEEIEELEDLLSDVEEKYGSDPGIKRDVADLLRYLSAAHLSYEADRERPKYYSEDERERMRAEAERRKIDEEETQFKRKMEEKEAEDAAEAKFISDSLARSAEMAQEMVKPENKRPIVIHKNIPKPGTPEASKKTPAALSFSIQGRNFEVPRKNAAAAKSILKEIEAFVQTNDISDEDERRLLAFTQEAEKAYSGRAVFEKEIAQIMDTLEAKHLNKQYTAVRNTPEVPVEIRNEIKEEPGRYMTAEQIAKVPVERQAEPQKEKVATEVQSEAKPQEEAKAKKATEKAEKKEVKPEQALREAVGADSFLSNLFLESNRTNKRSTLNSELGTNFGMSELRNAVFEYLAKVGTAPQKKYDKKKVLEDVDVLSLFGIKPENLNEFVQGLKDFLKNGATKDTVKPAEKPAPEPKKAPEPEPAEDMGKIVGTLEKELKDTEEFRKVMEALRKIQRMSNDVDKTALDSLQKKTSEEGNESFKAFVEWILQEKTKPSRKRIIRKLVEDLDDKSPAMVKGVVSDTLLRLNRVIKIEPKPAPTPKPAPAPKPKTDPLKESMEALKDHAQLNQLPGLIENFRLFLKDNPDLVAGIEAGAKREYIGIPEGVLEWVLKSDEAPNTRAVLGKIIENLKSEKTVGQGVSDVFSGIKVLWGEAINARVAKSAKKETSTQAEPTAKPPAAPTEDKKVANPRAALQTKLKDYATLIDSHPTDEEMAKALDEIGKLVDQIEHFNLDELEVIYGALIKTLKSGEDAANAVWRKAESKVVPPEPPATPEPKAKSEPAKTATEKTAPSPERTPMPDSFMAAIETFAAGDADKKERLLNLWEVAQGNVHLKDADLETVVRRRMHFIKSAAENGKMPEVINRWLNRLLEITETVTIPSKEAETKKGSYERLEAHFERLMQAEKYNKLKNRLKTIFRILKDDPNRYGEDDAYFLKQIQETLGELMYDQVATVFGISDCSNPDDFLEKMKEMSLLDQKTAVINLSKLDALMTDEVTSELIDDYMRIIAKKAPKRPAPSAAPSSVPPPSGESTPAPAAAPTGSADAPQAEPAQATQEATETTEGKTEFPNEKAKLQRINAFLKRYNISKKNRKPAAQAIRTLLMERINSQEDLDKLDAHLKAGKLADEVDQLIEEHGGDKKKLQASFIKAQAAERQLSIRVRTFESTIHNLNRLKNSGALSDKQQEELDAAQEAVFKLSEKQYALIEHKNNLDKAIKKVEAKKGKAPQRYKTPEHLLGAINMFLSEKEDASFEDVMDLTHDQIEEATKASYTVFHRAVNFLTGGLIKPLLSTTLVMLVEKDPKKFRGVTAEDMRELAAFNQDQEATDNWIEGLDIPEQRKWDVVVPGLIGYLENMINVGGVGKLNTLSLNRAKWLLARLRRSVHTHSIEHAKTKEGDELDKMTAYYGKITNINERAQKITKWTLTKNMLLRMGRNGLLAGALGTGALAGGAAIVGAGAIGAGITSAGMGALAGIGGPITPILISLGGSVSALASTQIKSPGAKDAVGSIGLRAIATGGLGMAALWTVPWVTVPAMAVGLAGPSLVKHRGKIWEGAKSLKRKPQPTKKQKQ